MKKSIIYIAFALLAANAFAKTTGFMMRNNGPLRVDNGKGGVEWSITVPAGTKLTVESEEPVVFTLVTEKENIPDIKFYKVTYEKKTYYARDCEVALGSDLSVVLSNTAIFTKPAISSFLNAQLEQGSLVVMGQIQEYAGTGFTEVQYWSSAANSIRTRYIFSDKLSSNKNDLEAIRTVDVAIALKNKDATKERQMKKELFANAKKLNTSEAITEYVQAEYDKIFGYVQLSKDYSGTIKTADGSKVNVRKAPVDGEVVTQFENGFSASDFYYRSASKSTHDGITDYWFGLDNPVDGIQWVFGGYIEFDDDGARQEK